MKNTIRYTALAAALLAGTAAASAQTVITTEPDYAAPPVVVEPAPAYVAPAYVAPAPGVVVEDESAPVVERRIVEPAPRVETETIVQPAADHPPSRDDDPGPSDHASAPRRASHDPR